MTITIDPHLTPSFIPISITVVSVLIVLWSIWDDRKSSGYFAGIFSAFILLAAIVMNVLAWISFIIYKIFS